MKARPPGGRPGFRVRGTGLQLELAQHPQVAVRIEGNVVRKRRRIDDRRRQSPGQHPGADDGNRHRDEPRQPSGGARPRPGVAGRGRLRGGDLVAQPRRPFLPGKVATLVQRHDAIEKTVGPFTWSELRDVGSARHWLVGWCAAERRLRERARRAKALGGHEGRPNRLRKWHRGRVAVSWNGWGDGACAAPCRWAGRRRDGRDPARPAFRNRHSSDLINPDQPPFWKFAGNERFHTYTFQQRIGVLIDWYRVLRSDERDDRFAAWGIINDPACCKPGDPECPAKSLNETYGFDWCPGDDVLLKYVGKTGYVDPACGLQDAALDATDPHTKGGQIDQRQSACDLRFGTSTGALGFRKFPNPRFDPDRWRQVNGESGTWDGFRKTMEQTGVPCARGPLPLRHAASRCSRIL